MPVLHLPKPQAEVYAWERVKPSYAYVRAGLPGGAVSGGRRCGHRKQRYGREGDASQVEIDIVEVYTGIFSDMGISAETVGGEHLLACTYRFAAPVDPHILVADFLTALRKKGSP